MSKKRQHVPLYHQGRDQIAGVEARLQDPGTADGETVTWLVNATSLGELEPKVGDRCRSVDGAWWTVNEVAPIVDGAWPLTCEREGGGA